MPAGALALGAGFPLFVAFNPHRFGPGTLASPLDGAARPRVPPVDVRPRFGARLAPVRVAGTVPEPPPGLDARPTGAVGRPESAPPAPRAKTAPRARGRPRPFRVLAVAGGAALIEHAGGVDMVRPGDALPDGRTLRAVRADGTLDARRVTPANSPANSPADSSADRPAQAARPIVPPDDAGG